VRSHEAQAIIGMDEVDALGVDLLASGATTLEGVDALDHRNEPNRYVLIVPIAADQDEHFIAVVTQDCLFGQEQVASYESFASQVSQALESVQLREHMHQRRSNRWFRALVENSSDVVLVVDGDGLVTFASPTVRRLLGREEAAVRSLPVLEFVYRPDQVDVRRVLAAPTRPGGTRSAVEVRLLHGSGELRWFEIEARDLTAEDEIQGIVLTASDISDRKRGESQVLRSEARFRLMVQNSSDVVIIIDDDNLMTYVSPAIERMLGYTVIDLMGRNVFELLSISEAERMRALNVPDIDGHSAEVHVQATDGQVRSLEVAITDMRDQPEVDGIVLNIRDVTDRKILEDDLRHVALHDDLTGLANRALLADRSLEAVQAAKRTGESVAALFVNVDDFKLINDSRGHATGDSVLLEVAARLQADLRVSDVAARLGADDFAVLLGGVADSGEAMAAAQRVRDVLGAPFSIDGQTFHLTASVGVAHTVVDRTTTAEDLLRQADAAMHAAKEAGKDRALVFEQHMHTSASEELETKTALVRAVENNEFVLHYQPIIDLATSQIKGVEALIRWEDPERGMIGPASFIPVAEESGLIRPIGLWVAAQAAQDLAKWRAMGFDVYCSINVSGRQMDADDFAQTFVEKVEESGVDPTAIVVELTESVLAAAGVATVFDRFHHEGFRLALDDFGTGYSAFQYLRTFHIDLIKIDRSFVQAMNTEDDAGVVEAVLDVAARIGAQTVAEGIENADELRQLKQFGVELGQGYYFSKPVPADRLKELLVDEQSANLPVGLVN
jgi:diguanylate cyclase (GGDEF)-like protein/PAS domain S-box-containing protein